MVAAHSNDLASAAATRAEDRAHRAAERERPRQGRGRAQRTGRHRGAEFRGAGGQARRLTPSVIPQAAKRLSGIHSRQLFGSTERPVDMDPGLAPLARDDGITVSSPERHRICIAFSRCFCMVARSPRNPMPFLREKSGRWSPEKIIAFVGACVPGALARVACVVRRSQSGAPGQRGDPFDRQLRGLARGAFAHDHARAPPVHGAEADQHAAHARRRSLLLRGAAPIALFRAGEIRSRSRS